MADLARCDRQRRQPRWPDRALGPPRYSDQSWFLGMMMGEARRGGSLSGGEGMGWASAYIEKLRGGEPVSFRPRGHSMSGKIDSGQLCTVECSATIVSPL